MSFVPTPAAWLLPFALGGITFGLLTLAGFALQTPPRAYAGAPPDPTVIWHIQAEQPAWTATDVHQALRFASARTRCVIDHEVGGVAYDPWSIGDSGRSRGPAQIHDYGLADLYARWSGGEPREHPYVSIAFAEWAISRGMGSAWTPIRAGLC